MNSKMQELRSLIICATPLQMLIAEKIIELNSDKNFDLLVLVLNDNEKYRYYYNRLKDKCIKSIYIVTEPGVNGFFDYIKKVKVGILNKNYQDLYLANIDSRYCHYIVSKQQLSLIYTFDDGAANITYSSSYYSSSKPSFLKRSVWRMLGIKYYTEHVRKSSLLHYTIYKNLPNIIENKQYISLASDSEVNKISQKKNKVVRFYLGQPLNDPVENINMSYVENVVDKLKIDYYYPHPREFFYPKGSFQLIKSSLIFEDYIVSFLNDHPDVNIEVFSIVSTALLNIISFDRVQATYFSNKKIFELYKDFYNVAKESFGVTHIDSDENIYYN